MAAATFDFVHAVVADRDLVVTTAHEHSCRVEPRESDLGWHCDLDDGTPTSNENDPASSVRWVCPTLRTRLGGKGEVGPALDVRRTGPQTDLGRLVRRLAGRADDPQRFAYTDPAGLLDADLRGRLEHWPSAPHGDGVVRPAELWSIRRTGEGLVVTSVSWWASAPALDHQIGLSIEVARRLAAAPS